MEMSQGSQEVSSAGNTKKPRFRSRCWFFTYNIGDKDIGSGDVSQCLNMLDPRTYVFQLEEGANGNLHYQGCVQFKNQIEFNSLKQLNSEIHWEVCKCYKQAIRYCSKSESRIKGPWTKDITLPSELSLIPVNAYNNFQTDVINLIEAAPDDRAIHWFWEERGNTGKTSLCKILASRHGALIVSGKASDIKYAVSKWIDSGKELKIVVFHFVRSVENFVSYDAIESIKDGLFFNSKYECNMYVYNPPHVLVFANFPPDYSKLSADRWKDKNINLIN